MSDAEVARPSTETWHASQGLGRLMLGRAVTLALQFALLASLARSLGPDAFGLIQVTIAVFVFVTLASDLGLSTLGTREAVGRRANLLVGDIIRARIILGAIVTAVVVIAIVTLPLDPVAQSVAVIVAATAVANMLHLRWVLQGSERFGWLGIVDVAASTAQLVAAILLVRGSGDIYAAAFVVALGPLVSASVAAWAARGLTAGRQRRGAPVLAVLRRALPLGIAALATTIYYSADSIILGVTRPIAEAGEYGAAYRVVLACLAIPFVAHLVAVPLLSRLLDRQDTAGRDAVVLTLARFLVVSSLAIAVTGSATADVLMRTIYGPAYADAGAALAILIWSCVTVSANAPFGALLLAERRDALYMGITLGGAVLNAALNLIVIPSFGSVGAAATTMTTEAFVLAAIVLATRRVSMPVLAKAVRAAIVPALGTALIVVPIRTSPISVVLAGGAFVALAVMSGAIRPEEIRSMASSRSAARM